MPVKAIFSTTGSFFKQGSQSYYLTGLEFGENYDSIEVTDTSTTGDGKEYLGGRAERTFKADLIMDVSGSDLTMNSSLATTASFEGKTYTGFGTLLTKTVQGSLDDAVKVSYDGRFNGAVTVTPRS